MYKVVYENEKMEDGIGTCNYSGSEIKEFNTELEARKEFDKFVGEIWKDGQGKTSTLYRKIVTLFNDEEQIDTK